MEQYISKGTKGIITNDPNALVDLLRGKNVPMANPQSAILPATSTNIVKQ
jgi:hypothetical protein